MLGSERRGVLAEPLDDALETELAAGDGDYQLVARFSFRS